MAPRPRKHDPTIPGHIDQSKIPEGVYWDRSGRGRWYCFEEKEKGKRGRKTLAGPKALLSELYAMVENTPDKGTVKWLSDEYHDSAKFKKLAKTTRDDYEYSRDVLLNMSTAAGGKVADLIVDRLRPFHIQRMVDRLDDEGTPTKANKLWRYARLLFRWGLSRGKIKSNPAQGIEPPKERKLQRLPATDAYMALLAFAQERAARKARTEGSVAPYLPYMMELCYTCRLRGIETLTITLAAGNKEGVRTNRRKGSKDSFVEWSPRLQAAWDGALALRRRVLERTRRPEPIKQEDRYLFLAEGGEPLSRSGLDSAWQRLIWLAIGAGVITEAQRFGLHDLKRKGGTEAPGSRGERQDALGVSEAMMKVYDHSVPTVKPSGG